MKFKPTMTLRFGAAHNSLTINDHNKTTVIDFNSLTRKDRLKLDRMAVDAWQKINKPSGKRRRSAA
jgi:hypothetical protein